MSGKFNLKVGNNQKVDLEALKQKEVAKSQMFGNLPVLSIFEKLDKNDDKVLQSSEMKDFIEKIEHFAKSHNKSRLGNKEFAKLKESLGSGYESLTKGELLMFIQSLNAAPEHKFEQKVESQQPEVKKNASAGDITEDAQTKEMPKEALDSEETVVAVKDDAVVEKMEKKPRTKIAMPLNWKNNRLSEQQIKDLGLENTKSASEVVEKVKAVANVDVSKLNSVDIVKYNPSVFNKNGTVKADADWSKLDLPVLKQKQTPVLPKEKQRNSSSKEQQAKETPGKGAETEAQEGYALPQPKQTFKLPDLPEQKPVYDEKGVPVWLKDKQGKASEQEKSASEPSKKDTKKASPKKAPAAKPKQNENLPDLYEQKPVYDEKGVPVWLKDKQGKASEQEKSASVPPQKEAKAASPKKAPTAKPKKTQSVTNKPKGVTKIITTEHNYNRGITYPNGNSIEAEDKRSIWDSDALFRIGNGKYNLKQSWTGMPTSTLDYGDLRSKRQYDFINDDTGVLNPKSRIFESQYDRNPKKLYFSGEGPLNGAPVLEYKNKVAVKIGDKYYDLNILMQTNKKVEI